MKAKRDEDAIVEFKATVRIDTPVEGECCRNGGDIAGEESGGDFGGGGVDSGGGGSSDFS